MSRTDTAADPHMHDAVLPGLSERVVMIDAPLIGISSTEIADRIRHGKSARYMVPMPVLDYILSHRLYQD